MWAIGILVALLPFELSTVVFSIGGHNVRSVHAAAMLLLLGATVARRTPDPESSCTSPARWFGPALGALAFLLVASTLFAEDFVLQAGMSTRRLLTGIAVAFIVADSLSTRRDRQFVLTMFVAGATAASCLGLLQLIVAPTWLDDIFWGRPTQFGAVERLTLPFGHANTAAAHLSLAVILGTALIVEAAGRTRRIMLVAATLISTVALTLTYSRSAIVATVVGLAVTWLLLRHGTARGADSARWKRWVPLSALVALVILAGGNSSWWLRVENPSPTHWYGVAINAPSAVDPGSSIDITVSNQSDVDWGGSPDENLEVATFDEEGNEIDVALVDLPALRASESTTLTVTIDEPAGRSLRIDVVRDGQGRFTSLTGQPPTMTGIGGATAALPQGIGTPPLDRTRLWRAALTLTRQHPITGVGVGNFRLNYQTVIDGEGPRTSHAHHLLLEPLASWGVPATLLFVAILAGSFVHALRRRRDTLDDAVLAASTAVAVVGLFDWTVASASGGLSLWLLVGLLQRRR